MAMATIALVGIAPSSSGAKCRTGGGDSPPAHLTCGVVESPIRILQALEEAQLAGAEFVGEVAMRCSVHVMTMPRGCDTESPRPGMSSSGRQVTYPGSD